MDSSNTPYGPLNPSPNNTNNNNTQITKKSTWKNLWGILPSKSPHTSGAETAVINPSPFFTCDGFVDIVNRDIKTSNDSLLLYTLISLSKELLNFYANKFPYLLLQNVILRESSNLNLTTQDTVYSYHNIEKYEYSRLVWYDSLTCLWPLIKNTRLTPTLRELDIKTFEILLKFKESLEKAFYSNDLKALSDFAAIKKLHFNFWINHEHVNALTDCLNLICNIKHPKFVLLTLSFTWIDAVFELKNLERLQAIIFVGIGPVGDLEIKDLPNLVAYVCTNRIEPPASLSIIENFPKLETVLIQQYYNSVNLKNVPSIKTALRGWCCTEAPTHPIHVYHGVNAEKKDENSGFSVKKYFK